MKNPLVITFTLCAFLKYWAGLYKVEEDAGKIRESAPRMMNKASAPAKNIRQSLNQATILMIEGP
jgi:hypothetical protein